MALKKHRIHAPAQWHVTRKNKQKGIIKPGRSPRRPGESAIEWTVRTAWLSVNATGKWVIKFTVADDTPDGRTTYRTSERSTWTTDKIAAEDHFTRWRDHVLSLKQNGPARHTFRDVVEAYKATRAQRYTGSNDYVAEQLCGFLGNYRADCIDEREMSKLYDSLAGKGRAPGTIRNMLSVTLTLLRYAERQGMIPKNSAPTYKLPPAPPPKANVLTKDQDAKVFAAATEWAADASPAKRRTGLFVCVALDTAQRREAILQLSWDSVDLFNQVINFVNPSYQPWNKRRCPAMPILPRLQQVLEGAATSVPKDRHGRPTGPMFSSRKIVHGFAAFREALDLPDWFTPHVCRHTWVTLAMGAGVPIETVSAMTGDNITTLQKTYSHVKTETHRENLKRFSWARQTTEDAENVALELAG